MTDKFTWDDDEVEIKRKGRRADDFQERPWSCGPAALVNAMAALGLSVTEQQVRDLSGADSTGTDEKQLMTAAKALGLVCGVLHDDDADLMWRNLRAHVANGMPCLLCVDDWDHWITATRAEGDRVVVRDPAKTEANLAAGGIHLMTKEQLLQRWQHREGFYAIALRRL